MSEVHGPRYLSETASDDPVMSRNDNSMVVQLRFGGRSVLFPGDLEEEGEESVVADLPAADVVLIPHHGSPTSSTPPFVAAVSPELAVVSCGRGNTFGFPAKEVVSRWRTAGAIVLSSHRDGEVEIRISKDGKLSWLP